MNRRGVLRLLAASPLLWFEESPAPEPVPIKQIDETFYVGVDPSDDDMTLVLDRGYVSEAWADLSRGPDATAVVVGEWNAVCIRWDLTRAYSRVGDQPWKRIL